MCAVMIDCTPASIAARNGTSAASSSVIDDGKREVRVDARCRRARGSASRTPRRPSPGGRARTRRHAARRARRPTPNERIPITGFCGFVLTSATGAKSRFTPTSASSAPIDGGHALGELDVVDDAERAVARVRAPGRGLEPRHVAALLVDRDHEVGRSERRSSVSARSCSRLSTFQAYRTTPPRPSASRRRTQSGATGPSKPGRMQLEASRSSSRAHALTAPAVSPKAIFRCTSRKKITTGIAVSVDAAMSPPQSVFRLVP